MIKILLVEDDEIDLAATLRYIKIERLPYTVHIAYSGEEAQKKMEAGRFDVILLDYDLKTTTGLELLPYADNTPVIFVTGSGTEEIAVEAIRRGASDYLVKDPERNYLTMLPLTIRTVIERNNAKRVLHLYEKIVDAAGELIAYLDKDFTFQAVNDAFLKAHNTTRDRLINRSITDLVKDIRFPEIDLTRLRRCRAGVKVHHESWFDFPGLGKRFMDVDYLPFIESDNSVIGVLVVAHDNTSRKKSEEQRLKLESHIQQAQKYESLNVMAGSIAHSFNNLLMGVLGNLELALSNLKQDSPVQRNIKNANKAAKRVAELSKLMLTYVGQTQGEKRIIELSNLVRQIQGILEASIAKNIQLTLDLSRESTIFKADPALIQQVIMNLVTNATEAIGKDRGEIKISTGKRYYGQEDLQNPFQEQQLPAGPYLFIEVWDNGSGMDDEVCSKAFDPFFTTRFKGRGMGLATVLGIVRGYKGAITLNSEPGKGTLATVLFPFSDTIAIPKEKIPDNKGWKRTGTVLLVDDEEMVLEVGREMLEELGYKVFTAADGIEAVSVFNRHMKKITCVILDMTMPRMGGEETFRRLREIKKDIPIIICSGYTEEQVAKRFMDNLPAPFIGKPFILANLAAILKKTLNGKRN